MSSIIRQQSQVTRTRSSRVAPEMQLKNTEAASDKTDISSTSGRNSGEIKPDSGLAVPSETSPPKKPSTKQKSMLKEAGSVLKTVIKGLGAAAGLTVGLAVGTVASTIAGAIRGSAEGSAAGAATGESYGGNVGRAIGSFAGGVVGGIAGALAGSVAIPVIAADTLARKAGSLSETKAPKEQADPATIGKHKASTESQLTVALENFKLAAGKVGLDSDTIDAKVTELKTTITANITTAYTDDCDLTSVDKQFRNKHDDFGLTSELATLLQSAAVGKSESKALAKSAMKDTKPMAIDTVGQNKAAEGFHGSITLAGGATYTTDIKMQTTEFVSSASNKTNGNRCGNLNLQTLTGADGTVLFKTLRHAALTAKPQAGETKDPLNPNTTVDETASRLCDALKSKDPERIEDATKELKKYNIEVSDFKGFFSGKIDEKSLTKKMAKQCGLLNKALDVGKAAWAAQGSPSGKVNITSLSLMTPDRPRAGRDGKGGEVGKLKDQVEAFKLLQNLGAEDLQAMGIGTAEAPVEFNVLTFNFGVNEGESLGAIKQREYNTDAMDGLKELKATKLQNLEESLSKTTPGTKEHAQLTVEKETIEALAKDIQGLYDTYTSLPTDLSKGLWRADQAYNLTAKIAFLTEVCDGVNTCNCASGKDRTGMHVQNSLNYATLMRDNMASAVKAKLNPDTKSGPIDVRSSWEMIQDPKTTSTEKKDLQARNKTFMSETGQHNVQEWNTGSPGYKLYSDTMPNLVTRGGQTESYFMEMFGSTKEQVANELTMQAKFNAT